MVTVQTGCAESTSPAESIHLREKNIAGPTERSRKRGEPPLRKLGGQDLRFSMKMMLTPDQEVSRNPSELLQSATTIRTNTSCIHIDSAASLC